jgi:hypothetical protein
MLVRYRLLPHPRGQEMQFDVREYRRNIREFVATRLGVEATRVIVDYVALNK